MFGEDAPDAVSVDEDDADSNQAVSVGEAE